jgi:translation initiation factor 4A
VPFTKNLDVIQQAQSGTGKTATFCAGELVDQISSDRLQVVAVHQHCQQRWQQQQAQSGTGKTATFCAGAVGRSAMRAEAEA